MSRIILKIQIGEYVFGLPVDHVREVIGYLAPTIMPGVPDDFCGLINLRGSVIPVLDLKKRLTNTPFIPGVHAKIVILEIEFENSKLVLGAVVARVLEVVTVEDEQLEVRPAFGLGVRPDFVESVVHMDGVMFYMLNIALVFSVDELASLVES